ncbi:conserved phage C-terminal domain-containing protein [Ureibacillus composti]
MTKVLMKETALLLFPQLAAKIGLNEAIVLQQLHFRLQGSPLKYDSYTWYNHTYAKWRTQFPFWSEGTIKRLFQKLEREGFIISTYKYNQNPTVHLKWYRINYEKLQELFPLLIEDFTFTNESGVICHTHSIQTAPLAKKDESRSRNKVSRQIRDFKKEKKKENNIVEKNLDFASQVIDYLNHKAKRNFRVNSKATIRLINGRAQEGYTLEDFKKVIDVKVKHWKNDPTMTLYLRPSTLFNPTNFENYLNEFNLNNQKPKKRIIQPFEIDYSAGEDW